MAVDGHQAVARVKTYLPSSLRPERANVIGTALGAWFTFGRMDEVNLCLNTFLNPRARELCLKPRMALVTLGVSKELPTHKWTAKNLYALFRDCFARDRQLQNDPDSPPLILRSKTANYQLKLHWILRTRNLLRTNKVLNKIKPSTSVVCTFCQSDTESSTHYRQHCPEHRKILETWETLLAERNIIMKFTTEHWNQQDRPHANGLNPIAVSEALAALEWARWRERDNAHYSLQSVRRRWLQQVTLMVSRDALRNGTQKTNKKWTNLAHATWVSGLLSVTTFWNEQHDLDDRQNHWIQLESERAAAAAAVPAVIDQVDVLNSHDNASSKRQQPQRTEHERQIREQIGGIFAVDRRPRCSRCGQTGHNARTCKHQ